MYHWQKLRAFCYALNEPGVDAAVYFKDYRSLRAYCVKYGISALQGDPTTTRPMATPRKPP